LMFINRNSIGHFVVRLKFHYDDILDLKILL
jgi:hypothetical protein